MPKMIQVTLVVKYPINTASYKRTPSSPDPSDEFCMNYDKNLHDNGRITDAELLGMARTIDTKWELVDE